MTTEDQLPPGVAPIRLHAIAGLPVMEVRLPDGSEDLMALDPASGAFVIRRELRVRLGEFWSTEVDRLDGDAFGRLVWERRAALMLERIAAPIAWARTGDGAIPYRAVFRDRELRLRINDFPAEPLYSVICEGQNLGDLEDWPETWRRPD